MISTEDLLVLLKHLDTASVSKIIEPLGFKGLDPEQEFDILIKYAGQIGYEAGDPAMERLWSIVKQTKSIPSQLEFLAQRFPCTKLLLETATALSEVDLPLDVLEPRTDASLKTIAIMKALEIDLFIDQDRINPMYFRIFNIQSGRSMPPELLSPPMIRSPVYSRDQPDRHANEPLVSNSLVPDPLPLVPLQPLPLEQNQLHDLAIVAGTKKDSTVSSSASSESDSESSEAASDESDFSSRSRDASPVRQSPRQRERKQQGQRQSLRVRSRVCAECQTRDSKEWRRSKRDGVLRCNVCSCKHWRSLNKQ